MAANYLKRKSLSSLNILHQLKGLSLTGYTPGAVQPLSLLSEDRKSDPNDKLYDVDKSLIPIFRRLKGLSYRRIDSAAGDQTDDSLEEHDDPDGPQPPKRSRFEETVSDNSSTASSMTTSPPPTRPPSVDNLEDQVIEGLEMFLKDLKMCMTVGENDTVDSLELNEETICVQSGQINFKGILGKRFADLGGASIVVTLLLARNSRRGALDDEDLRRTKIRSLSADVLIALCLLDKPSAAWISESQEILNFCFETLASKRLYEKSSALLEVIFMHRPKTLNLCSLPNLHSIIETLDGHLLANFCKILSLTISDLDMYDQKSSLYQQNLLKRSLDFMPVRDVNQELVLSIPGFLSKLVNVAVKEPYEPRFPNVPTEIDHWMRLIDDSISTRIATNLVLSVDDRRDFDFIGKYLLERVDAMSVLSLLMAGKHRKEVQRQLAELKLIPRLSELFDTFIWKHGRQRTSWHLPGHHTACECSPEVAVKIQFLRLVHSFCDNCDYKYTLLSPIEWEELERVKSELERQDIAKENQALTAALAEGVEFKDYVLQKEIDMDEIVYVEDEVKVGSPNPDLMCKGKKGLLSKIVDVLGKEPITSTFRFWLCRAIESYLKGRAIIEADQIFLLRRGLVQCVTSSLINTDPRQKEIVQSSFDLLGELMKYNLEGCRQMDSILNTELKLKKAMILINESLVDSNMFIRAMVLAADHFVNKTGNLSFALNSRLLTYFRGMDKHIGLIERLTRIIHVNSLTQENISCLNTALVILMVNRRHGKLSLLLSELANRANRQPRTHVSTLNNLRNLLLFWQEHYLHKDKDCTQLEKSSQIKFHYWKSTVAMLVENTTNSFNSILRFMEPDSTNLPLK